MTTDRSTVSAVLGPTNTGKTHLALERMVEHPDGVIGFPLRLLARENYDKLRRALGADQVALVTGEEKIVPRRARYFVCTVEAMPVERDFSFVAVDEVQLAADPDRGHVFTARVLAARGTSETMFLGSETARAVLSRLVPHATHERRPRLSELSYVGSRKLTRLPPRTAVIAFSVDEVYATAELLRRHRGGTAVVLGALSPRTRNAQVALYQERQVDYLVATDAIGMGLNLDIDHVAFGSLRKFDGEAARGLTAAEIAQIAGRAGRAMKNGTFGTTEGVPPIAPADVDAVERHSFAPLGAFVWRNPLLDFASLDALVGSLRKPPPHASLVRGREADDARALCALAQRADVRALAAGRERLALLWETCQIPDYRKLTSDEHARLVYEIFVRLTGPAGRLPADWVERQIADLDHVEGDVDHLIARIANVRTWTYVANRERWHDEPERTQALARAAEERLSDALHERLTQRFVDRLASTMVRRAREGTALGGALLEDGRVLVEGEFVGRLRGFVFVPDPGAAREVERLRRTAAARVLRGAVEARVALFEGDDDDRFDFGDGAALLWRREPVGRLVGSNVLLKPSVDLARDSLLEPSQVRRVLARLAAFVASTLRLELAALFESLAADVAAPLRGLAYQLAQNLGAVARADVAALLDALGDEGRRDLERYGVRVGVANVWLPALATPRAVSLRRALWAVHFGRTDLLAAPVPEGPSIAVRGLPEGFLTASGFVTFGSRAYRLDALERFLADAVTRRGRPALDAWAARLGADVPTLARLVASLGARPPPIPSPPRGPNEGPARPRGRRPPRPPRPGPTGPTGP